MICCLSGLYVWLVSLIEERVVGIKCPVESEIQRRLEMREKKILDTTFCWSESNENSIAIVMPGAIAPYLLLREIS